MFSHSDPRLLQNGHVKLPLKLPLNDTYRIIRECFKLRSDNKRDRSTIDLIRL